MRIYLFVALLSLGYLPFIKLSILQTDYVNIIQTSQDKIHCRAVASDDASYYLNKFILLGDIDPDSLLTDPQKDVLESSIGNIYWGVGTDSIHARVLALRKESKLFDNILQTLEATEYPFYILAEQMDNAAGTFSSLHGELRFSTTNMKGFLFDATIIEEFVHAYQATFYEYTHGNCLKRDFQFAQLYGDATDHQKLEKRTGNWEKFGRKHAYIESEAKIICYLIQNECNSISLQQIVDTDDYNSGGKARAIIFPYLKKRNCLALKRLDRLQNVSDYYIEFEVFMRYQHAFVRHWKKISPYCSYTKGKFRQRPEALQALCN